MINMALPTLSDRFWNLGPGIGVALFLGFQTLFLSLLLLKRTKASHRQYVCGVSSAFVIGVFAFYLYRVVTRL